MFGLMSALSGGNKETSATPSGGADTAAPGDAGLLAGTRVATAMGWRPVEAIAEGDRVLTFDHGLQAVEKVVRVRLWPDPADCAARFWPLHVPAGALGNRDAMHVLPGQNVMIESDAAEDLYGDPFSLIPAKAVEGAAGVHRVPPEADIEVIVLHFARDQIVFANNGALFLCPACHDVVLAAAPARAPRQHYAILSMDEARFLVLHLDEAPAPNRTSSTRDTWAAAAMA